MHLDLQSVYYLLGSVGALLVILGTVFGWFGNAWRWVFSYFKSKPPVGVIDVPSKTIILIPVSSPNACWWHMGERSGQPMMQIVGDLNVTNISKFGVVVMGAKMRKPKATGDAFVSSHDSEMYSSKNVIPVDAVSDLRFDFYVQPPVRAKGTPFKADIAIIDQFGNEHWLKGLEFPYL